MANSAESSKTPLLDSLIGKITWEKTFDGSTDNVTVKFGRANILGTFHLSYEGNSPKPDYLRTLARQSIALFISILVRATEATPKEQYDMVRLPNPWRLCYGRKIDLMPQTIDKGLNTLFSSCEGLTEEQHHNLINECNTIAFKSNDELIALPEHEDIYPPKK